MCLGYKVRVLQYMYEYCILQIIECAHIWVRRVRATSNEQDRKASLASASIPASTIQT